MTKRFTFLMVGALLSGAAFAGTQMSPVKKAMKDAETKTWKMQKSGLAKHHSVSTRADYSSADVLTSAPGTPVYYNLDVEGLMYGESFENTGNIATILYDGNTVYFYDIMNEAGFGTYVKGSLNDDQITLELPQVLYYDDTYGYGYLLTLLEENAQGVYEMADGNATFTVFDDGDIVLELPEDGDYVLGLVFTDDFSDAELSYSSMVYSTLEEEVIVMPEGAKPETYYFNDGNFGHPVQVAFDNGYLYMEGLVYEMPSFAVIRAEVNGNQATIPQDQFVGVFYVYKNYTKCVEKTSAGYELMDASAVVTLDIDAENNMITYAEGSPLLCINADPEELFELAIYDEFILKTQETFDGTPINPVDLEYTDDYLEFYGYYSFIFSIPNLSAEGNVLKMEDLYYKIYIDGDAYEFIEEYDDDLGYNIYDGFGQGEEVPLTFTNGNDFYTWTGSMREVGIYVDGVSTIGVQTIYKYEGVTTESEIVTLNIETGEITTTPAGVESLIGSDIKNVKYYDLSGRRVMNPAKGIYILKAEKEDGSVATKKVIVK